MQVGLIGLGLMGTAMGPNLANAGFSITGFDVDKDRCAEHAARGVTIVDSPAAAASVGTVLLSLPNSDIGRQVCFGDNGVIEGKPALVIDTTTARPADTIALGERFSEAGVGFVDATMSGNAAQAAERDIVAMVGGTEADFEAAKAVLEAVARSVHHVGPVGSGAVTKLIVNQVLGIHRVALAEGLVMGERAGVDLNRLLGVLKDGAAYSKAMDVWGQRMVDGDHVPSGVTHQTEPQGLPPDPRTGPGARLAHLAGVDGAPIARHRRGHRPRRRRQLGRHRDPPPAGGYRPPRLRTPTRSGDRIDANAVDSAPGTARQHNHHPRSSPSGLLRAIHRLLSSAGVVADALWGAMLEGRMLMDMNVPRRSVVLVSAATLLLSSAMPALAGSDRSTEGSLSVSPVGTYSSGVFAESATEIVAHDPRTQRLFTVNAADLRIDVLDVSDPTEPVLEFSLELPGIESKDGSVTLDGAVPNSVAVRGTTVAVAVEHPVKTEPGWVAFFTTGGQPITAVRVGALPDMLAPSRPTAGPCWSPTRASPSPTPINPVTWQTRKAR
jgi:3-hydroxyisobutyrate dehydrogenase-like beta-hydroxyacid dehydrogenase